MSLTTLGESLITDVANKNVDWNETDPTSTSYIMNKPADVVHDDKIYGRKNGDWEEIKIHVDTIDFDDFAPVYSNLKTYQKDDIVSNLDTLYKAKENIEIPEDFNVSHWQEIILSNEFKLKQDKLTDTQISNINNAITDDNAYAKTTDLENKQNKLFFDYAEDGTVSGIQTVGAFYQKPYSAGDNIDITEYTISGKDWTDTIVSAVSGKADKEDIPTNYVKKTDLVDYTKNDNIAVKYNNLLTYTKGQLVFRNGLLYKAQSDVPAIDVDEVETLFPTYFISTYIAENLANKQDKLTAGDNISIVDNVISATGGGSAISPTTVSWSNTNVKIPAGTYTQPDDFKCITEMTIQPGETISIILQKIGNINAYVRGSDDEGNLRPILPLGNWGPDETSFPIMFHNPKQSEIPEGYVAKPCTITISVLGTFENDTYVQFYAYGWKMYNI